MNEGVRSPRSGGRITTNAMDRGQRSGTVGGGGATAAGARGARRPAVERTAARRTVAGARAATAAAVPLDGTAAVRLDRASTAVPRVERGAAPGLRVAPPPPVTAPRAPFVVLILALVIAGVFGILLINTKTNENAFVLDQKRKEQAALDASQQDLEGKIAEFEQPGNLRAMAAQLGLVPGKVVLIRQEDGKLQVPVPPAAGGPQSPAFLPDGGR